MRDKPAAPKSGMLAFAPSYEKGAAKERSAEVRLLRNLLTDLPGARQEVQQLEASLPGAFYYSTEANEARFKELSKDYQILHLAMHGMVNNKLPQYSSLVFTENQGKEDNLLYAYELQQMNLSAELVFLSACETGFGMYQKGEGVASLGRSFMYAGVLSVVQSLWKINDKAGAEVVTAYYTALKAGQNKDQALRQAKLDYLQKAKGLSQHPFYWAGFVQLGNIEALQLSSSTTPSWRRWWIGGIALLIGGLLFLRSRQA